MSDIKVSVIVPIYNVEEYLYECLESVANQTLRDIEVLMIDDGSTDKSAIIAKNFDEKYEHFHYFYKENGGLGQARNYAIPFVKGEYLIFLDSDDVVPSYAYEKMYNLAIETGNDLIIGNVKRFNSNREFDSNLHKKVFTNDYKHTHILENRNLIYDTTSWNKLFKTSFYLENNFKFPENILYEDIPVTIPAHFKANSVGVISDICYLWRVRDGVSKSITQDRTSNKNFLDRVRILDMLNEFYDHSVSDVDSLIMKDYKSLDIDLKLYVNELLNASDEFIHLVFKEVNRYLSKVDEKTLDMLRTIDRMKYYYIQKNDVDGLLNLLRYQKKEYKLLKISKKNGEYMGNFPMNIDDSLKVMTKELAFYPLQQYVTDMEIVESQLIIDFIMYIPNLIDQSDFKTTAYLYDYQNDESLELSVVRKKSPQLKGRSFKIIRNPLKFAKYNYDNCKYTLTIDLTNPKIIQMMKNKTNILLKYENDILQKELFLKNSSESQVTNKDMYFNQSVLNSVISHNGYVRLTYKDDLYEVNHIELNQLNLMINDLNATFVLKNENNRVSFDSSNIHLENVSEGEYFIYNGDQYVYYLGETINTLTNDRIYSIGTDSSKRLKLCVSSSDVLIEKMNIIDNKLVLRGLTRNPNVLESKQIVLFNKNYNYKFCLDVQINTCVQENEQYTFEICLDLKNETILHNLATGEYELYLQKDYVNQFRFVLSYGVEESKCQIDNVEINTNLANGLALNVWHKWSKWENNQRKRRIIRKYIYPILRFLPIKNNVVVFEGWWGSKYHCNPKYFYEYIDKNYKNYKCVWLLNDDYIPIHGNGIRIRRKSLKYYYYLAVGKYFINNVNFHDEYEKRNGQIEIQTMHGTPLKTLGLDVPGELNTEEKRNLFLRRCNRWDYLIVQSNKASEITASCYAFKKEFLRTGYPRNDILFEKNNEKDIALLKEKMGIPTDKKVLMYAPTWRKRDSFEMKLDLEDMKKTFGEDYVLILRVHPFAYKGLNKEILNDFVLDFSSYESVEELYLVSDVVITDYSSVMFDYTILNRPILFYTYDLKEYRDDLRGFNFDFEAEAPGPIIATYDELKQSIVEIDDTYKQYYEALQNFRRKFNEYEKGDASKQIYDIVFVKKG